jgi:hypothetical protein
MLLAAAFTVVATVADPSPAFVTMVRDVAIPETYTYPLPRIAPGTLLPCMHTRPIGHSVLCYDSGGPPRLALLPHRTEWGLATAKSWLHDAALPSNTVAVLNAVDLEAGTVRLGRGDIYPIVATNADTVTIRFTFADFRKDIRLKRGDVEPATMPPPPQLTREDDVLAALKLAEAHQKELKAKLRDAIRRRERLLSALESLRVTEVENEKLRAEIAAVASSYRKLAEWKPSGSDALDTLVALLRSVIEEQDNLNRQVRTAQLEIEPLRFVQALLLSAKTATEESKVELAGREAEREALIAGPDSETTGERYDMERALEETRKEHAELTRLLTQTELGTSEIRMLFELVMSLRAENDMLNERVADLMAEIEAARASLAEPDDEAEPPETHSP